jgi:hypothetical protein
MGLDGHQIRAHKLIIDTDPGIGASPASILLLLVFPLPPPPLRCVRPSHIHCFVRLKFRFFLPLFSIDGSFEFV